MGACFLLQHQSCVFFFWFLLFIGSVAYLELYKATRLFIKGAYWSISNISKLILLFTINLLNILISRYFNAIESVCRVVTDFTFSIVRVSNDLHTQFLSQSVQLFKHEKATGRQTE